MDGPQPKETKGVPWADHNPTASTPEDSRREEYPGEGKVPDEKSSDYGSSATERSTDEDRTEIEHDL
jgi:hypothetical protein